MSKAVLYKQSSVNSCLQLSKLLKTLLKLLLQSPSASLPLCYTQADQRDLRVLPIHQVTWQLVWMALLTRSCGLVRDARPVVDLVPWLGSLLHHVVMAV